MRRFIAILVAVSLPSAAPAASWVFVANCGEEQQTKAYSYDRDSVRADRGNVLVRVRGDYSRSVASRAQEAQIVWSFNCASGTFSERSRIEYGRNREVIANYPKPTGQMGIMQNSITEKVRSIVCA